MLVEVKVSDPEKYSSQRYGCCPRCKHEDESGLDDPCRSCDRYVGAMRKIGLFIFDVPYYHKNFEPKGV